MTSLERCKAFGVANIRGMAYMPGPSNYTKGQKGTPYFDSDFYKTISKIFGKLETRIWGATICFVSKISSVSTSSIATTGRRRCPSISFVSIPASWLIALTSG
jgi:hypothetical protein